MQLQRIRVTNFRKLTGPVEIGELPTGLAVIGGANEEGKSTLLEAIR
ncbi:AAA family ATPase, partial [Thiohalorhabdus sp.]